MVNQKRLVDNFLRLASILSYSGSENELSQVIQKEFTSLDIAYSVDNTGNIHAVIPENGKGYKAVMFCCHMDTVKLGGRIIPLLRGDIITSDGTSILGADDKAGIVCVLEMLHILHDNNILHGNIEVVFTVMEEKGLLGAKAFDCSILRSKLGYIVDGGMKPGHLTVAAPYKNRIEVAIKGKAAHAGANPEAGISAIQVAAKSIADMKLLRIDEQTTANIGTISGGTSENIVCPEVAIIGEVRSHNTESLKMQTEHMRKCVLDAASVYGAEADFHVYSQYSGYDIPLDQYVVSCFKKACAGAGLEFRSHASGGGTDANIFNEAGISAVVIGMGVKNPHTMNESISVNDLKDTAKLLIQLVKAITVHS